MANILIYKNNVLLDSEEIKHEYYIVETYEQESTLFWFESSSEVVEPHQIRIWIQTVDYRPVIMTVLPEWEISIDGAKMEKKLYIELEINYGSIVELRYRNYKFKVRF